MIREYMIYTRILDFTNIKRYKYKVSIQRDKKMILNSFSQQYLKNRLFKKIYFKSFTNKL
ncbi:hypothetical protein Hdeb2414_s0004g00127421 [Helianthus debilis subsp. tardiflorus]